MKKVLSRILYVMFFGFVLTFCISCILLIFSGFKEKRGSSRSLEAVIISDEQESGQEFGSVERISLSGADKDSKYECKIGYESLTDSSERELYSRISRSVYSISGESDENRHYSTRRIKLLGVHLSESSIRHSLNAFLFDTPQVFWLGNLFGYAYSGDDTVVECYSVLSADECTVYEKILSERVSDIISGINPLMSQYEKEKYIHDSILKSCIYKDDVTGMADGWQYFSAYGALVDGTAVCEGYSKAMQLVMSECGVPCCTVRGVAGEVEHMWNLVCIRDEWYHLDPTWDDGEVVGYEYFNLTGAEMAVDHAFSPPMNENGEENAEQTEYRNFFLPDCRSDEMNYYKVEGFTVEGFGGAFDDKLINYIVKRVNSGEAFVPLVISEKLDYNEVVDKLFYASPYKFYYYIDVANERMDGEHRIDRDGVRILKKEEKHILRIKLNYS